MARCSRAPSGAGASGDIDQQVLYGTENGLVGLAVYDGAGLKGGWVIDPVDEGRRGKSGGVLCVRAADLTKSGGCNILVGRDDGLVEVWSLEGEGTLESARLFTTSDLTPALTSPHLPSPRRASGTGDAPQLVFERNLHESVVAIDCGAVSNTAFDEVVVATYSGKILSFSSAPSSASAPGAAVGAGAHPAGAEAQQLEKLAAEIDALEAKAERERALHARKAEASNGAVGGSAAAVKLQDKWALASADACYTLSLELAVPLEGVLLQSDVPVTLLEARLRRDLAEIGPRSVRDWSRLGRSWP